MEYNKNYMKEVSDATLKLIQCSQKHMLPPTGTLFHWEETFEKYMQAKKKFLPLVGQSLIKEIPNFSIQLSQEEIEKKRKTLLSSLRMYLLYGIKREPVEEAFENSAQIFLEFFSKLSCDEIFTNHLSEDYKIYDENKELFFFPKNAKFLKTLKKFFKREDQVRFLQDYISLYIQSNKIKGTLCLSIHPLDFLTCSENNYNWRSCHALDGNYRSGNLSYLLDTSTLICYIKSEEPDGPLLNIRNSKDWFKWNDKKWRCWIHLSEDNSTIALGRQYPQNLGEQIKTEIHKLLGNNPEEWSSWNTISAIARGIEKGQLKGVLKHHHCQGDPLSLCFNDIVDSGVYEALFSEKLKKKTYFFNHFTRWKPVRRGKIPKFNIGEEVICLYCGEAPVTSSRHFICKSCIDFFSIPKKDADDEDEKIDFK